MVKNVASMQRKFREAPKIIHDRLVKGLERIADDVVGQISVLNPLPGDILIDWTWGDAPRGAITIGKVGRGKAHDRMAVTIFATTAQGSGFSAWWFEAGTKPRVQKTTGRFTGSIAAQSFFWPTYRANELSIKSRLRGVLKRAVAAADKL